MEKGARTREGRDIQGGKSGGKEYEETERKNQVGKSAKKPDQQHTAPPAARKKEKGARGARRDPAKQAKKDQQQHRPEEYSQDAKDF